MSFLGSIGKFLVPGSQYAKKLGKIANFPQASEEYRTGQSYLDYGKSITQSALAGLDKSESDLQGRLAAGLPADVRQTFATEHGAVRDEQARSGRAFAANLVQRAKAGGGAITDQAALDSSVENNAQTEDAAFQAHNQIAAAEADASLQNTYKMLDDILGVQQAKLGAGLQQENVGSTIYRSAVQAMLDRRKAIAGVFGSIAGGAVGSSREFKTGIVALEEADAIQALVGMTPVIFTYKESNESHVGFIAEDVPDLVAMTGRKALHPMDFVGVLTKVVQAQQRTIESLTARLDAMEAN